MKAIFFTVADPQTGLGHLFRCDALAEAFARNNIDVQLVVDCKSGYSWLSEKPLYSDWTIVPWLDNVLLVDREIVRCDIPVFDAYDVSDSVWKYLKNSGRYSVLFDDYGEKQPLKGFLINGSPGAELIAYPEIEDRELLLGPKYQVLRPPFWECKKRVITSKVNSIGVMIGGTDHLNLQSKMVSELADVVPGDLKINVIGKSYIHTIAENFENIGYLDAQGIKRAFKSFDLLISAAGQTIAEAVSVCLPTIIFKTAENQKINYQGWVQSGAVIPGADISEESLIDWNKIKKTMAMSLEYEIRKRVSTISYTMNLSHSTDGVCNKILSLFRRGS